MPWAKIEFEGADAERRFEDFQVAFRHLLLRADEWPDRDAAAMYEAGPLALVLSPVAAEWMGRAVPPFKLEPCERPAPDAVQLLAGDSLCRDTTYPDLSHAERVLILEELRLDDEAAAAMADELDASMRFSRWVPSGSRPSRPATH